MHNGFPCYLLIKRTISVSLHHYSTWYAISTKAVPFYPKNLNVMNPRDMTSNQNSSAGVCSESITSLRTRKMLISTFKCRSNGERNIYAEWQEDIVIQKDIVNFPENSRRMWSFCMKIPFGRQVSIQNVLCVLNNFLFILVYLLCILSIKINATMFTVRIRDWKRTCC